MKILIIEDESLAAEKLERMLKSINPDVEIMATLGSVLQAINWLSEHPEPDVVFMDIQLDDGICFEIFEAVKFTTPVIFTTAYDNYAIRAFEVNSIDYLLKPIESDALVRALEKYKSLFEDGGINSLKLSQLFEKVVKTYKTRFFVKIGNHFHSIPVSQIDCFFIRERAIFLSTRGKHYDLDYSLDQIQKLVDPEQFFRINRNFLINIDSIEDIYRYSSSRLGVRMGEFDHMELTVSREKVTDFKEWLDR